MLRPATGRCEGWPHKRSEAVKTLQNTMQASVRMCSCTTMANKILAESSNNADDELERLNVKKRGGRSLR